jgi:hypothetical protein
MFRYLVFCCKFMYDRFLCKCRLMRKFCRSFFFLGNTEKGSVGKTQMWPVFALIDFRPHMLFLCWTDLHLKLNLFKNKTKVPSHTLFANVLYSFIYRPGLQFCKYHELKTQKIIRWCRVVWYSVRNFFITKEKWKYNLNLPSAGFFRFFKACIAHFSLRGEQFGNKVKTEGSIKHKNTKTKNEKQN